MSTADLSEVLTNLIVDLQPYIELCNEHNCEYFSRKSWNLCLSKDLQFDVQSLTVEDLRFLVGGNVLFESKGQVHLKCFSDSIKRCLHISSKYRLNMLKVTAGVNDIKCKLSQNSADGNDYDVKHISHALGVKKSHEIQHMSHLCAEIATSFGFSHLVDIGSGKGYLGCNLALQYGLSVLGVDASINNAHEAEVRNVKMEKLWPTLVEKSRNNFHKKPFKRE